MNSLRRRMGSLAFALGTAIAACWGEDAPPQELRLPALIVPPEAAAPVEPATPPFDAVPKVEDPQNPERLAAPYVDEGFAEFRSRNFKAALAAFDKALHIHPGDRRARFGMGTALIADREYVKARNVLESLAKDFPDDYTVKNNLAWLYATAADPQVRDGPRALRYAQEVVIMAPRDHHVWSTLAEAYFINEKYEDALRAANEALRLLQSVTREPSLLKEYERQVAKCRLAVQALSILE